MRWDGKMKSRGGRFSQNFDEMVEKIKAIEEERGNKNCSDSTATEIIYTRIQKLGGLKEN